ncbi:MAG: Acyl-CoA thioesterase YbgC [Gammaproteobacteria bacterium]|nr:Acyl-CoA thioesterase YbgC [Gammaproteobacteria bacterium]
MSGRRAAAGAADFVWPVRVYYEDTDAGGVVYHANYLKFMERARTEWLRSLGWQQDRLLAEERVVFAVRHLAVDYLRPARFNDALNVRSRVGRLGSASIEFEQDIVRADCDLLCRGVVVVACIDTDAFRPRAIPDPMYDAMKRFRKHAD